MRQKWRLWERRKDGMRCMKIMREKERWHARTLAHNIKWWYQRMDLRSLLQLLLLIRDAWVGWRRRLDCFGHAVGVLDIIKPTGMAAQKRRGESVAEVVNTSIEPLLWLIGRCCYDEEWWKLAARVWRSSCCFYLFVFAKILSLPFAVTLLHFRRDLLSK